MKCCNKELEHRTYNGLSVKAQWDICTICLKEHNREVSE